MNDTDADSPFAAGASPFGRVVCLDWYDGPVSGILECRSSGRACHFFMLAWDDTQDRRIFCLSPLPAGAMSRLLNVLAPEGPPQWPVWAPQFNSGSEAARAAERREIDALLSEAQVPAYVIAAADLMEPLLAVRKLSAEDAVRVRRPELGRGDWSFWASFAGI